MKKVMKFTATLAFMCIAAIGMANEPELYLVPNDGIKSLIFKIEDPSEKTTVSLRDEQEVFFFEALNERIEYLKKFNLSKLNNGVYTISVEDELKVIRYKVTVSNDSISIGKKVKSPKPVFRIKGDVVYLNLLNLDSKKVIIRVYDGASRLVFSENLTNEIIIEKAFNFENAYEDNYSVIVEDNSAVYSQSISID